MEKTEELYKIIGDVRTSLNLPKWKKFGLLGKTVLSTILASLPSDPTTGLSVGGIATLLDKIGDKCLQPDFDNALNKIMNAIELLAPEIKNFQNVNSQVASLLVLFDENKAMLEQVEKLRKQLMSGLSTGTFSINTDNAFQEFVRIIVKDLNVMVYAHNGGKNILHRFKVSGGDVQFNSTNEGEQIVSDSEFVGRAGNAVGVSGLIGVKGGVRTVGDATSSGFEFYGPSGQMDFYGEGEINFGIKK